MTKNFVLDTNVLLHDPRAIFQFKDNTVVLPIYVIEELDTFKKNSDELGRNARQISRYIDELRNRGSLSQEGAELPTGGRLKVLFLERNDINRDIFHNAQSMDSKILGVARSLNGNGGNGTILVSKDINMRIRADSVGLKAVDYEPDAIPPDELYTGTSEYFASADFLNALFQNNALEVNELLNYFGSDEYQAYGFENEFFEEGEEKRHSIYPNQFILLKDIMNPQHTALARVEPNGQHIVGVTGRDIGQVWGIWPLNKEQRFALSLLLDDRVKFVTLVGKAGTGKTLLAIAAGLQQTVEEERYQRLLVSRPIFPLGRDIGYLPGTMEEKLNPWMQPIFDNVEFLMSSAAKEKRRTPSHEQLMDMGVLQIEPLTYIRGRSIPQQFMIVDEAQNLTPHEVKTIITRAGHGTKIVLTGDPYQIDHPYIDALDNGLVHAVKRFKSEGVAGHVTLQKGERSELAELAANLL